jgi:hypothetical protein
MQSAVTRLSHVRLTLHERLHHLAHLFQTTQRDTIALNKAVRTILSPYDESQDVHPGAC